MDVIIENKYKDINYFSQVKNKISSDLNNGFYLIHDNRDILNAVNNGINKIILFYNVIFKKRNFSLNFNEVIKSMPDKKEKYICLLKNKIELSNISKIENKEIYLKKPIQVKEVYRIVKNKDKIILFEKLNHNL